MIIRLWIVFAALSGLAGVGAGAAAAHALEGRAAALAGTGSQYAIYHALALLALAAFADRAGTRTRLLHISGALFMAGILLFSGSLFVVAWTGEQGFTRLTPFGGTAFLLGWTVLAGYGLFGRSTANR